MASRDLTIRIDADPSRAQRGFKNAEQSAKVFERELKKIEDRQTASVAHVTRMRAQHERQAAQVERQAMEARRQALGDLGKVSLAAGTAMAAGVALSVRAAAQWESAWAGVLKTADTDDPLKLGRLETDLRQLARTLPATHQEIAAVAEAAGQLGVSTPDVARFTKTMIDLGETTDLTADQAATSLAQLMNVMQTAPEDVGRLGAALVDLGNNGASTESQILEMALRISGAGRQVGLAESDVLAMANALASLGINAEAGGSAISKTLSDLAVSVATGSDDLQGFADVAGMSVGQFTTLFEEDAAKAVGAFTDGLGRIQESGGSAIATLDEMGIKEIRQRDLLLRLAGAQGIMNASVDLGREAWAANSALVEEANKRYATTEARMQVAKNAVNDLAIDLGSTLLPALASGVDGVASLANTLSGLPGWVKASLSIVATLGAVVLTSGGAMLLTVPKVMALKAQIDLLALSAPNAAKGMALLGKASLALGAVGAIIGVAVALDQVQKKLNDIDVPASEWNDQLLAMAEGGKATGEVAKLLGDDFSKVGDAIDAANNNKLSLIDGRGIKEVEKAREVTKELDAALAAMVTSGNADQAAALFEQMSQAAIDQGRSVEEVTAAFPAYGDAMVSVEGETRAAAAATEASTAAAQAMADALSGVEGAAQNAYSGLGQYAASIGLTEEGTKKLTDQVGDWAEALADFVQPLGAYQDVLKENERVEREAAEKSAQAQNESVDQKIKAVQRDYDARLDALRKTKDVSDEAIYALEDERDKTLAALGEQKKGWEDYTSDVKVKVGDYLAELERQVEAQETHSDNMLRLAGRVSQGTLDELARMGPEGAPLVAELVNASDAELDKLDDLFGRRTKEATGAMAAELYLAQTLLPQLAGVIGQKAVTALALELSKGTTTVAQIAADYSWALEGGLKPLLNSLGIKTVTSLVRQENAQARRPRMNADGHVDPPHVAQIARAGEWRVWAEDETGGEAYIPLAASKRQRSVGIWQETGRRLGVYKDGGFYSERDVPPLPSTKPYGPPISTAADRAMGAGRTAAVEFLRQAMMTTGSGSVAADGELSSNAVRAKAAVLARFGRMTIGGWGTRPNPTEHDDYIGGRKASRALDFMTTNVALGNAIADFMHTFPGATYSIWNRRIRRVGGSWRPYNGRSPHTDHVHTSYMAKGGILNPHVRDRGGPLRPGFTFNGTGGDEMVIPMAAGGILPGGAVSATNRQTLTGAVRGLTDISAIQRTRQAWLDYAESLEQAARKRELVAEAQQAAREVAAAEAKGAKEQVAASRALTDAERRLRQVKSDTAKENAGIAVRRAEEKLAKVSTDELRQARERLADANQAVKDFDHAAARDRESAAVDRLVAKLEREVQVREELADIRDRALDRLNDMLDEEKAVRDRGVQAERDYTDRVAAIGRKRAEAEARLRADSLRAAQDLQVQQQRIIDARRQQLDGWARLDQVATVSWGNTVEQLLGNARDQAEQFEEWMASLADARSRGVSEQVIAALGLDEGPAALGQLRQFGQATAAEIDALNAEVARRTTLAGQQTAREQQNSLGQTGRDLVAAQQQYVEALSTLQQRFAEDQAALDEELVQAQSDLLVRQAELATELAAIGGEQGRSYGAALAEGMASQLAAVQQAARALQAAMGNASAAGARLPGVAAPGAPPRGTAGQVAVNGQLVPVNAAGIITSGPYRGRYPAEVMGLRTATFDSGGWLQPGLTLAYNGTGAPERVVTAQQAARPGLTININGPVFGVDHLHQQIRAGAQALLADQRDAALAHGSLG